MSFRLLLVGCGARGRKWDEVVHRLDGIAVVGYVDSNLAAARTLAKATDCPVFSDLNQGLKEVRADAVLLVTPPDTRQHQMEAILQHRLPVLSEKPLAVDLPAAVAMVQALDAAEVPLSISVQYRYLPVTRKIREFVTGGQLGQPGFSQFTYLRNRDGAAPHLNKYPLTMKQPMLLEETVHHYDLIRYCYGAGPVWLQAHTWNPSWSMYAHDSNVAAMIEMSNGVRLQYLGTWTAGWNEHQFRWRTDFERGIITQESNYSDLFLADMDDSKLRPVQLEPFTPNLDDTERLLRQFVDSIQAGTPGPCSGRDHLQTLAMVFAVMESSETGSRVDMNDFRQRHGIPPT
jgi:predicted dehydrogenase